MAKPSFCRGIPITDCITVVQCKVQTRTLNRPIYVGFTVLELSKLHMYEFHYQHMKVKYPCADQLKLLSTDIDSLAYAVKTDDIYEDMAADATTRYGFSEYPLDHPLYDASNRKTLGYFKYELNSIPIKGFVGLRPKCYANMCTGKVDRNVVQHTKPVEKKTAEGVKRKVKEEHLHYNYYHYATSNRLFASRISSPQHHTGYVQSINRKLALLHTTRSGSCARTPSILTHMAILTP